MESSYCWRHSKTGMKAQSYCWKDLTLVWMWRQCKIYCLQNWFCIETRSIYEASFPQKRETGDRSRLHPSSSSINGSIYRSRVFNLNPRFEEPTGFFRGYNHLPFHRHRDASKGPYHFAQGNPHSFPCRIESTNGTTLFCLVEVT